MSSQRTIVTAGLVIAAFAAGAGSTRLWFGQPGEPAGEQVQEADERAERATWYTCGMHPEVVQDHPGTCPKCGMNLQPMSQDRAVAMGLTEPDSVPAAGPGKERTIVYWKSSMIPGEIHTEAGKDSMGMDLIPVYEDEAAAGPSIRIDPVTEQNMGIRVASIERGPVRKTVRTVGFVEYDETTLAVVTTKVDGWVEKLYVDQTGMQVHVGDPLFELYSPELFSAQQEYLAAIRNLQPKDVRSVPRSRLDSKSLIRDARTRLEYFDISSQQIRELEKTGKVRKTLTIRSPFTGIVTHKNVVQGRMVKAGADLFEIADLSTVWVIGKVFEYDLPHVRLGQEAYMTLSYLPGKTFRGRVTYVYPYLETKTREVSVRIEFHNPGYELKPGMYATVSLTTELQAVATLVPDMAVINTGLRSIVFTMPEPGRFESRDVKLGARVDNNYVQVLQGLAPGETVVVSGQFLLDSESRLREAALKFTKPGKTGSAIPAEAATGPTGAEDRPEVHAGEGDLYYACPMPGHTDILYDEPGKCPLCGMDTIPVRHKGQKADQRIAHWTCPMPEHASVRKPGPGKCPICRMSLVPVMESTPREQSDSGGTGDEHDHAGANPQVAYWTCPMPEHASVRESEAGKCPICGMDLVPVSESTSGDQSGSDEVAGGHEHGR